MTATLVLAAPAWAEVMPATSYNSWRWGGFTWSPISDASSADNALAVASDLGGTASLSGFVYVDTNGNQIMDAADFAIADTKLSLTPPDGAGSPIVAYSQKDGSYNFSGLPAGTYSISMTTPVTLPGQDNGQGRAIFGDDEVPISVGTQGTILQNAYNDIALDDGQKGTDFNFAQAAYPVAVISKRLLLSNSPGVMSSSEVAPILATTPTDDSTLDFGYVLVDKTGDATLTATNVGSPGSALNGNLPDVGGNFGSGGAQVFGPLDLGQEAGQQYSYTPDARGSNSLDVTVTSNGGDSTVTLSGTGVAPIQSVSAGSALARIGTTDAAYITVSNIGDGNLSGLGDASNLKGVAASSSGVFAGAGGSFNLPDNGTQTFGYTYTPTGHTTNSTPISLQFENGSANGANLAETVNQTLEGRGVGPVYQSVLSPDSTFSFGELTLGVPKLLPLQITNATTDDDGGDGALTDLTLLNFSIMGLDSGLFTLIGFTDGMVLHQGDSLDLEINYNGTGTVGDKSALLSIYTDEDVALGAIGNSFDYQITANIVPEPSAAVLLGTGAVGLFAYFLRRRKRIVLRSPLPSGEG